MSTKLLALLVATSLFGSPVAGQQLRIDSTANLLPPVVRFLNPTEHTLIVQWRADTIGIGQVYFGTTPKLGLTFAGGTYDTVFSVKLAGLLTATRYHFRLDPPPKNPGGSRFTNDFVYATLAPKGWTEFLRLPVLIVVYTPIHYRDSDSLSSRNESKPARLSDQDVAALKAQGETFRTFFWRNTKCKLDLVLEYLFIDTARADLEKDLEKYVLTIGKKPEDFAGVIFVDTWNDYLDPAKSAKLYRGQALAGETYGVNGPWKFKDLPYSVISPSHGQNVTYALVHEFHRQIDALFYASGYPEYPSNDPNKGEVSGLFGEYYDCEAFILRNWPSEHWSGLHRGEFVAVRDDNNNGIPDDARVAVNDRTFGSGKSSDTTWTPMKKLLATNGILSGVDERWGGRVNPPDGRDGYPLTNARSDRPKKTPILDGKLSPGEWEEFATLNDRQLRAKIYFQWDDSALYFAAEMSRPASLHLDIDAGNNGWFYGGDNYRLAVNSKETGATDSVAIYDWSFFPRQPGFWNYEKIRPEELRSACTMGKRKCVIELAIPKNEGTGLRLQAGNEMNIRIGFDWPGNKEGMVTLFEPHRFFGVKLVENNVR